MTNDLDPTESPTPIEEEMPGDHAIVRRNGRFSLLFVGLTFGAALFLGAAIGYRFGRSQLVEPARVVVTATPGEAVAQAGSGPTQPAQPTDSAGVQPTPSIMDFVLSDARHFQGSAAAPITMIEFSDFK
jgi:protein-disulfide isomerase